jgi:hypothetical protein
MTEIPVCMWCGEPVTEADSRAPVAGGTWHRECLTRSIVGSIGHLKGRCSCFIPEGGATEDDPPEMTKRAAARAAAELFSALGDAEWPRCSPFDLDWLRNP